MSVITARKRSLRRLCFYTCQSVILFTEGWVSRPIPGGGGWRSGLGVSGPHPGGCPGPHLGGSRLTPGGCVSQHALRQTPPPNLTSTANSYCCRPYASYWNAFFFFRITDRMGSSPILYFINTIIIGIMVNNNSGTN